MQILGNKQHYIYILVCIAWHHAQMYAPSTMSMQAYVAEHNKMREEVPLFMQAMHGAFNAASESTTLIPSTLFTYYQNNYQAFADCFPMISPQTRIRNYYNAFLIAHQCRYDRIFIREYAETNDRKRAWQAVEETFKYTVYIACTLYTQFLKEGYALAHTRARQKNTHSR